MASNNFFCKINNPDKKAFGKCNREPSVCSNAFLAGNAAGTVINGTREEFVVPNSVTSDGNGGYTANSNAVTPELYWGRAAGGNIGKIKDGDIIEINIPERSIRVKLSDEELAARRKEEEARGPKAFTPPARQRTVSKALRAYAKMVSSADQGAVRIVED